MKELLARFFEQQGLRIAILFVVVIVILNALQALYLRNVIVRSSEISQRGIEIQNNLTLVDDFIRQADMGVRGYLLNHTQVFLDPFTNVYGIYRQRLDNLENSLAMNGFNIDKMAIARTTLSDYMETLKLISDLVENGSIDEAMSLFNEDRGKTAWGKYSPFIMDVTTFVNELNTKSQKDYKNAINFILGTQILFLFVTLPVLVAIYRRIGKDNVFRNKIFHLMDESNRKYLYNDGQEIDDKNEDAITGNLVGNLKKAAGFINSIGKGRYDVDWEGMTDKSSEINKENIAGELLVLREQLIKAKKDDEIRIWTNEGLSRFSDLIRNYQNDISELSDKLIAGIVDYIGADQGGLFFLNEDDHREKYLELVGCYAYQRKKFLEKRIELGQGMVGQCFLEGETTYLTNVPKEYMYITSGLGLATPKTLLIVPLKINEDVVGVIEIAGLRVFDRYKIDFLERLSESIASSITSVRTNERTKTLLMQSQQQAEEMRAQEEEMRQNMEELQATQEQMNRKNEEVENLLRQASENEESMRMQMEALGELENESNQLAESMKKEAEDYRAMLVDILNEIPGKVFLKDAEGKIFIANQKVADVHGLPVSELIGKSDYDFVDKETADQWRQQELDILAKGEEKYTFEDNIGGQARILETTKKAFEIKPLNQTGLLGIQNDITELVTLQNRIKALEAGD
jgi:PAS domain S-box-containing protein